MALLYMLCFLLSVTLSEIMAARSAQYTKHTTAEAGAGAKKVECGLKYLDEQFGVFTISDDGTDCTTEPWAWFDTKVTETGYTHYIKDRMKITFEPLLIQYSDRLLPKPEYLAPFPSPMYTGSKVDVYFTPKIPIRAVTVDLLSVAPTDVICHFKAFGNRIDESLVLRSRINGKWTEGHQLWGAIPFNTEKTYKVTINATQTELQMMIDDQVILSTGHVVPSTHIRYLKFNVDFGTEVQLNGVEFFMNAIPQ